MPPPRKKWRVLFYVLGSVFALGGVFWYFGFSFPVIVSRPTLQNVSQNLTRDWFQDLYELSWRADGKAGNTVIEAVYYFPELVESLQAYAERSLLQARTLQALQNVSNASLHPFLILLENSQAIDQNLKLEQYLTLRADQSVSYPLAKEQPLKVSEDAERQFAAVVWFEKPEEAPIPSTLTLTFENIPGNIKPSSFFWNTFILGSSPEALE